MVLLRDPVTRLFSHLAHHSAMLKRSGGPSVSAAELPQGETELKQDMLWRGVYEPKLRSLWEYFPREQVCVLYSEEFRREPAEALTRVQEYLGLPVQDLNVSSSRDRRRERTVDDDPAARQLRDYYRPHVYRPHVRKLFELLGDRATQEWSCWSPESGTSNAAGGPAVLMGAAGVAGGLVTAKMAGRYQSGVALSESSPMVGSSTEKRVVLGIGTGR